VPIRATASGIASVCMKSPSHRPYRMGTDRAGEIVEPGASHSADAAVRGGGFTRLDRVGHCEWRERDRYHPPRDAADNAASLGGFGTGNVLDEGPSRIAEIARALAQHEDAGYVGLGDRLVQSPRCPTMSKPSRRASAPIEAPRPDPPSLRGGSGRGLPWRAYAGLRGRAVPPTAVNLCTATQISVGVWRG
jgi:hypothetical protein